MQFNSICKFLFSFTVHSTWTQSVIEIIANRFWKKKRRRRRRRRATQPDLNLRCIDGSALPERKSPMVTSQPNPPSLARRYHRRFTSGCVAFSFKLFSASHPERPPPFSISSSFTLRAALLPSLSSTKKTTTTKKNNRFLLEIASLPHVSKQDFHCLLALGEFITPIALNGGV